MPHFLPTMFSVLFSLIPLATSLDCPVGYTVVQTCQQLSTSNPQPSLPELIWLSRLNSYRSKHHSPPLTLSKELQTDSQNTAKKCTLSDASNDFGKTSYIEYSSTDTPPSLQIDVILSKAISSWYNTINQYDFKSPQFDPKTGHATQLLWKSTTNIGCSVSLCKLQTTSNLIVSINTYEYFFFVVCSFFPPGNIKGMFEQNVQPI
jgi:uncharacterized protein YkwD